MRAISLCYISVVYFNTVLNTTIYNYLKGVMATCFGCTFNHHQALKKSVQVPKVCTLWDPIWFTKFVKMIY